MVSDGQVAEFQRDGFLVLEGFARPEACAAARERAEEIVEAFEPSSHRTVFTTNDQVRVSDELFLSSGDRITCFFEEEALAPDGTLTVPKEQSINKIGHALHDLDPVFERFSYTPELAEVAADVGLPDALALQSMYIFKQPSIGGEVGCHQDATFLWTDPISVVGLLVRHGGRHARERLPVGRAGRPPRSAAPAVPAARRRRGHGDARPSTRRRCPTPPDELQPLPVPAGTMVVLARPAPPLERRQPLAPQPPRLLAPLHLGRRRLPGVGTGCSGRPDMPLRPLAARAADVREGSSA